VGWYKIIQGLVLHSVPPDTVNVHTHVSALENVVV